MKVDKTQHCERIEIIEISNPVDVYELDEDGNVTESNETFGQS